MAVTDAREAGLHHGRGARGRRRRTSSCARATARSTTTRARSCAGRRRWCGPAARAPCRQLAGPKDAASPHQVVEMCVRECALRVPEGSRLEPRHTRLWLCASANARAVFAQGARGRVRRRGASRGLYGRAVAGAGARRRDRQHRLLLALVRPDRVSKGVYLDRVSEGICLK